MYVINSTSLQSATSVTGRVVSCKKRFLGIRVATYADAVCMLDPLGLTEVSNGKM